MSNQNVNGYIVYDLDNLPKISLNNFKLKNFLFGLRNIVKKRLITVSMYVVTIEQHSMEQVDGVLVMSLIGMLQMLVSIISSCHTNNPKKKLKKFR